MVNEFTFEHTVFLNETNAMAGVVYFSNFVKWQGMARESILRQHPKFKEIMSRPIEMITRSCSVNFLDHLYFGDEVLIKVSTKQVLPASFVMVFHYLNKTTNKLVAIGEQKIAFADLQTRQLCMVPDEICELAKSVESK